MPDEDPTPPLDWSRVKVAFGEALELEGPHRAAHLAALARRDAALHAEVLALLASHERSDALQPGSEGAGEIARHAWTAATSDRAPDDAPLPASLGRFEVRARLGRGGMGEVLAAFDPDLARDVALKLLPPGLDRDLERRRRFLREARAAAGLTHPHIAAIHEIGSARLVAADGSVGDERDYIALEFVPGRTLAERLAEQGAGGLAADELFGLALPLADALAAAHAHGVIHRDVKAENVLVTPEGTPKLVDFGLAKLLADDSAAGADSRTTLAGAVFGTPGAMSPEQALGRPVDARSDVFSFGSLLYELATGRSPFRRETPGQTLDAVIREDPPPLGPAADGLPPGFEALLARSLAKAPEDRYPSMADLAADLGALREGAALAPATRRAGRAARRRARGLRRSTFSWVVVVVLAAAVAWRLASGPPTPASPTGTGAPALRAAVTGFTAAGGAGGGGGAGGAGDVEAPDAEDADPFAAMLAQALTHELSSSASLDVVGPQRVRDAARLAGLDGTALDAAELDDTRWAEVAELASVDLLLRGRLEPRPGGVTARVALIDADGTPRGSVSALGRGADDVFVLAESLATQVRTLLAAPEATPAERRALAAQLTDSVAAWRAYVAGQQWLQRNDPAAAVEAFDEATRLDPDFALAHFRTAMAQVWTGHPTAEAYARALALRDRLPDDLAALLDGIGPYLSNDRMSEALPFLLETVAADPWQRDVLYHLGEVYTHSATFNDVDKAAWVYGRLLDLDPDFSLVYGHAFSAWLRAGRFGLAREKLGTWQELAPDDVTGLPFTLALWEGRLEEAADLAPERLEPGLLLDRRDAPPVAAVLESTAVALADGLADHEGLYLATALDLAGCAAAQFGQLDKAAELFERTVVVPGLSSPDGFHTSVRAGARHRLGQVLALRGQSGTAHAYAEAALSMQPQSPRCLLAATVFAVRAGDLAAAREHVSALDALVGPDRSPTTALHRDGAASEVLLAEGDAAGAVALFERALASGKLLHDWYAHEDSAGPWLRDGLARARLAAGDAEGAIAAYTGLIDAGLERLRHPVPWVRALLLRGELLLAEGRTAEGRADLERFLDHWGDDSLADVALARALLGD